MKTTVHAIPVSATALKALMAELPELMLESAEIETVDYEAAGLEESGSEPIFGLDGLEHHCGSVNEQVEYLFDGDDARYD